MKKLNFYSLFYIFVFASIFGWVIEGLWTLIKKGVLINHSAVIIGPFNFVYGICAVVFSILLYKIKDRSSLKVFAFSFILGTILEYLLSLIMEFLVGFTAWDYSHKFLNINGRVSLMYSFLWGILGLIWIKYLYPLLKKLIDKFNPKIGKIVMIYLIIFLSFDLLFTYSAVNRAKNLDKGIPPHNSYERFLDKTFNRKYLTNMFNNQWYENKKEN